LGRVREIQILRWKGKSSSGPGRLTFWLGITPNVSQSEIFGTSRDDSTISEDPGSSDVEKRSDSTFDMNRGTMRARVERLVSLPQGGEVFRRYILHHGSSPVLQGPGSHQIVNWKCLPSPNSKHLSRSTDPRARGVGSAGTDSEMPWTRVYIMLLCVPNVSSTLLLVSEVLPASGVRLPWYAEISHPQINFPQVKERKLRFYVWHTGVACRTLNALG